MKKIIMISILSLGLTVFIAVPSFIFASGPGTTGANFLKIAVGSRAVGIGEAFVAVADDVNTIFYNPAGLNLLNQQEVTFMYNKWFEDIYQGFVGYALPCSPRTALGLGIQYLSMKKIPGYDQWDYEIDSIKAQDIAFTFSYSKNLLKNFYTGANIKYINQQLDDKIANAYALDIGSFYRFTTLPVSLGCVLQNFGTEIKFIEKKGVLPMNLKFGSAVKLFNKKFTVATDLNLPNDNDLYFNTGSECWLLNLFALRIGYWSNMDLGNGLTYGIGFKVKVFQLDYAFVDYGILNYTHRISLLARFGKSVEEKIVAIEKPVEVPKIEEVPKPVEAPKIEEVPKLVEAPKVEEAPKPVVEIPVVEEEPEIVIEPGVVSVDIQPIINIPREYERATTPPKPVVLKPKTLKEDTIVCRVFFEFESSTISPEAEKTIDEVTEIISKFPDNKIIIEGHTCAVGGLEINEQLSSDRAWAISGSFVRNGIPQEKITVRGLVYNKPVVKNDTLENRAKNRRVDIFICK